MTTKLRLPSSWNLQRFGGSSKKGNAQSSTSNSKETETKLEEVQQKLVAVQAEAQKMRKKFAADIEKLNQKIFDGCEDIISTVNTLSMELSDNTHGASSHQIVTQKQLNLNTAKRTNTTALSNQSKKQRTYTREKFVPSIDKPPPQELQYRLDTIDTFLDRIKAQLVAKNLAAARQLAYEAQDYLGKNFWMLSYFFLSRHCEN